MRCHYDLSDYKIDISNFTKKVSDRAIDNVILHVNYEDYFLSSDKVIDFALSLKTELEKYNITLSLYPRFKFNNFKTLEEVILSSKWNKVETASGALNEVCPLDIKFKKKYVEFVSTLTRAVEPYRLFLDVSLTSQACYCEKHMKVYGMELGMKISKEDFIAGVSSLGSTVMQQNCLDTFLDTNNFIENDLINAVMQEIGSIRLGFNIDNLAYKDFKKDWKKLFELSLATDVSFRFTLSDDEEMRKKLISAINILNDTVNVNEFMLSFTKNDSLLLDNYVPNNVYSKLSMIISSLDTECVLHNMNKIDTRYESEPISVIVDRNFSIRDMRAVNSLMQSGFSLKYCTDSVEQGKLLYADSGYLKTLSPYDITKLFKNNFVIVSSDSKNMLKKMGIEYVLSSALVLDSNITNSVDIAVKDYIQTCHK